jgi:A/G-specific adenine glycosylase
VSLLDLPLPPKDFAERVLAWFDRHGRGDLPWQGSGDPYRIWISEIMLQQTQVATVIPYYQRFLDRFPDVAALADASQDEVLALWSGLGYYARGRNLHRAAQWVVRHRNGRFPHDVESLRLLPGIGRSTAAAIAVFSGGGCHAILDGNVQRVLGRLLALDEPPGAARARRLWAVAEALTPQQRVGDYTQAMMDLGATCCTPRRPRCGACPLHGDCRAAGRGQAEDYPRRGAARPVPEVALTLLIVQGPDGRVWLERRPARGVWGGMWCLPECPADLAPADWCLQCFSQLPIAIQALPEMRHVLTHRRLHIQPWRLQLAAMDGNPAAQRPGTWHRVGDAPPGGMVKPVLALLAALTTESQAA